MYLAEVGSRCRLSWCFTPEVSVTLYLWNQDPKSLAMWLWANAFNLSQHLFSHLQNGDYNSCTPNTQDSYVTHIWASLWHMVSSGRRYTASSIFPSDVIVRFTWAGNAMLFEEFCMSKYDLRPQSHIKCNFLVSYFINLLGGRVNRWSHCHLPEPRQISPIQVISEISCHPPCIWWAPSSDLHTASPSNIIFITLSLLKHNAF